MPAIARLGLLVGSSRNTSNGIGIAAWLKQLLNARLNAPGAAQSVDIVTVDPTQPPHPFGPIVDGSLLPAQVPDSSSYPSPVIRDWSRFVSSCAGFVVVSPEYNGGYPGELKNALDHLYKEWHHKPVLLLTYGGGGGLRSAAQLQPVLTALKMQIVPDPVGVKLPGSYTGGSDRVLPNGDFPEFLAPYVPAINGSADKLKELLFAKPTEK